MVFPDQRMTPLEYLHLKEWIPPTQQEQRTMIDFWVYKVPEIQQVVLNQQEEAPYFKDKPLSEQQTMHWKACMFYLSDNFGLTAVEATLFHRLAMRYQPYIDSIKRISSLLYDDKVDPRMRDFLLVRSTELAQKTPIPITPYQKDRLMQRIETVFDHFHTKEKEFYINKDYLKEQAKQSLIPLLRAEETPEYVNILSNLPLHHTMHRRFHYSSHEDVQKSPPLSFRYESIQFEQYTDEFLESLNRFMNVIDACEYQGFPFTLDSAARHWLDLELKKTRKSYLQQALTLNQMITMLTNAHIIGLYKIENSDEVYIFSHQESLQTASKAITKQLTGSIDSFPSETIRDIS